MIPTKVNGTAPPLLLMHLNAKGTPTPLPAKMFLKTKSKKGKKNILNCKYLRKSNHAYRVQVGQPSEFYMFHFCAALD